MVETIRISKVNVHPLVLLSVSDHFDRSGKSLNKRVIGTLLGSIDSNGVVEVTNCFAVPFEENKRDELVWFLDHKYHEQLYEMFLKVNAKEKVVGWYSSGPTLCKIDLDISKIYENYCDSPILLILDSSANLDEIKPESFCLRRQSIRGEANKSTFLCPIPVMLSASDPEEIGVEQLLRDVRDKTASSLSQRIKSKEKSLKKVGDCLKMIADYLQAVDNGQMPRNERILKLLKGILNDAMSTKRTSNFIQEFVKQSNNSSLLLYIASLTKMVLSLANLVDNRVENLESAKRRAKKLSSEKSDEKSASGSDEESADEEELINELMEDDGF